MSRALALLLPAFLVFAPSLQAEDYPGAEIVKVEKGTLTFKHGDKTLRLPLALSLRIFNDKGEQQDVITGSVRFLLPGNKVDIKTGSGRASSSRPDSKTKSKTKFKTDDSSSRSKSKTDDSPSQIVEIRFVSGKVGELPKAGANVNLKPDPEFKGSVIDSGGHTTDPYWLRYIPTAKVGDFAEYHGGRPWRSARTT